MLKPPKFAIISIALEALIKGLKLCSTLYIIGCGSRSLAERYTAKFLTANVKNRVAAFVSNKVNNFVASVMPLAPVRANLA